MVVVVVVVVVVVAPAVVVEVISSEGTNMVLASLYYDSCKVTVL